MRFFVAFLLLMSGFLLNVCNALETPQDISFGRDYGVFVLARNGVYLYRGNNNFINLNKKIYSINTVSGTKQIVYGRGIAHAITTKEVESLAAYLHVPPNLNEVTNKVVYPIEIDSSLNKLTVIGNSLYHVPGIVATLDPQDGHTIKVFKLGTEEERKKMYLTDIAVNSDGEIYVADYANSVVYHLNSSGEVVAKWGSRGGNDGQFKQVWGLAIDPRTNDVYVSDIFPGSERGSGEYPQRRIQVFDRNGKFKRKWGGNEIVSVNWWPPRWTVRSELGDVVDIAINDQGEVYLLEKNRNKVSKYTNDGKFLLEWGEYGSAQGQFNGPEALCLDDSGNIYVADTDNDRVQKFDPNGKFLEEIK